MTDPVDTLPHWRDLPLWSDADLARLDIAVMNLACAAGLPGTAHYDPARCLRCLDDWAVGVRQVTDQALETEFRRHPSEYDHSEPLFRMVKLVHALQRHCRVLYNPAKVGAGPDDPLGADDQFIHGAIRGPGGTCASLPVVYAAVARRLGYPVFVVYNKGHAFCRWDDPATGARVNIEGTSRNGVNAHPDEHYRAWPAPFDAREEAAFGYMRSLPPRGELAEFLLHRSAVWRCAGEFLHAVDAAAHAAAAEPTCFGPRNRVFWLVERWVRSLRERGRIGHGFHYPAAPDGPRRWPDLPWALEAQVLCLDAAERGAVPRWMARWDDSGRNPNPRLS